MKKIIKDPQPKTSTDGITRNGVCSKCGKDMKDETGKVHSMHSMLWSEDFSNGTNPKSKFFQKQCGKYKLKNYEFCYECFLDAMFAKIGRNKNAKKNQILSKSNQ